MKWKFQFSLSSLLWFTLCLALLLTSILMYRRMIKAEVEAKILRKAAGYLVIGDRNFVHGIEIKTYEPLTRRWRLYLPEKHHYVLKVATGDLPPKGEKYNGDTYYDQDINETGEIVVCAEIHRHNNGECYIHLSCKSENLDFEKGIYSVADRLPSTMSVPISSEVMKDIEYYICDVSIFGESGIETSEPDKRILLARERLRRGIASEPMPESASGLMPGYMIWLEERDQHMVNMNP